MWCCAPCSLFETSNTQAMQRSVSWVSLFVTTCLGFFYMKKKRRKKEDDMLETCILPQRHKSKGCNFKSRHLFQFVYKGHISKLTQSGKQAVFKLDFSILPSHENKARWNWFKVKLWRNIFWIFLRKILILNLVP